MTRDPIGGEPDKARPPVTLAALQAEVRFLRAVVLLAVIVLLVLFAALRVGGCAGPPRAILVDGKIAAYVHDHGAADRVHRGLLAAETKSLPGRAVLKESWQDFQPSVLRPDDAIKQLQGKVHVLVQAFAITANGKFLLALPTKAMADQVLATTLARFTAQGEKLLEQPRFKEKVPDPVADDVPAEDVARDPAKALELLVAAPTPGKYVVQAGDSPDKIARKYGLTVKQFLALNPGLRPKQIHAREEVIIGAAHAPLTVITIRQMTEKQPIPPPEKKVSSTTLPAGETKVIDPGTAGEKTVTLRAVFENDRRVKTSVISQQTTVQPKPRTIAVGAASSP